MGRKSKQELELEAEQERIVWTTNMFQHIRNIKAIRKPSTDDPISIERACKEYFALCENDGVPPTVAGLARALGTNRSTLMKWLHGEISIRTADVVMEYFSLIEIFDESALKNNKTNAVAGLFNMKNNYDYKDEVEHKIIDERKPTMKEIAEKYGKRAEIIDAQPSAVIDYTETKEDNDSSGDEPF